MFILQKCSVIFDTAVSANHTFIRVISTPTVPYSTPLVWYAHFIFTAHSGRAFVIFSYVKDSLQYPHNIML